MSQPIIRWKLGWKRCSCVPADPQSYCDAALTIEQTEEDCGWVRWIDVADLAAENERLKAENERLRKAAQSVELAFQTLDNGLIETPAWVKQQAMRDAVSQLRAAAKEGGAK